MLRYLLPLTVLLSCGAPIKLKEPAPAGPGAAAPAAPTVRAPAVPKDVDPAPVPKALRVHVIGASVSGGFEDGPATGAKEPGDSVTLQQVLEAWAGDDGKVSTHNPGRMMAMFTDPVKFGREQLAGVRRSKPDVLVAIDFPFWFAYGYVSGDELPARSARFAEGLAMLDQLEMPVVLGDLPDMHGAAQRMLSARQIPSVPVLRQLNEQLAAFVKARANMHLVPLGQMVRTMKDDGVVLPLATGAVKTPPGALLQEDRLHSTRLGMAFLGHSIQDVLRSMVPARHALRERSWTFEQFVAAAGAEGDLEQVVAAAQGTGK